MLLRKFELKSGFFSVGPTYNVSHSDRLSAKISKYKFRKILRIIALQTVIRNTHFKLSSQISLWNDAPNSHFETTLWNTTFKRCPKISIRKYAPENKTLWNYAPKYHFETTLWNTTLKLIFKISLSNKSPKCHFWNYALKYYFETTLWNIYLKLCSENSIWIATWQYHFCKYLFFSFLCVSFFALKLFIFCLTCPSIIKKLLWMLIGRCNN